MAINAMPSCKLQAVVVVVVAAVVVTVVTAAVAASSSLCTYMILSLICVELSQICHRKCFSVLK